MIESKLNADLSLLDNKDDILLKLRCIYCNKGSTEENPYMFRVYSPGMFFQHWNFENIGCEENTLNISPMGVPEKQNKTKHNEPII